MSGDRGRRSAPGAEKSKRSSAFVRTVLPAGCRRRRPYSGELHLFAEDFLIKTACFGELGMSAPLHDLSFFQNQNLIGVLNRGKPMGNHKGGSPPDQSLHGLLNEAFRFGVHARGSVIE